MSESTETAILAGAVSGPRRSCCATAPESSPPASATPAGKTTTRPPAAIRVTPRRSRSSSIPGGPATGTSWSSSSRSTGPTWPKGWSAPTTAPRSSIPATSSAGSPRTLAADADASGLWPGKVVTKISAAGPFWEAEAEDQDYLEHYPGGKNQFRP